MRGNPQGGGSVMYYTKVQEKSDRERGVLYVNGVCFESEASNAKIRDVFSEISRMEVVPPALMTRKALCLYIEAPEYISGRMASMPIGTSFEYDGIMVTRWSDHTYNGQAKK